MRFGRFSGLVLSLFLPAFYRDVARNWGGIGLLYLLLLFTLTWIPGLVKIHLAARKFADEDFPKFANKLPDISIKNGKVTSPEPQPLEIKDDVGNVVFVLDTTGKINNLEQTKAMFLITQTKFFQRDQMNNIQIHDLSTFPDFDFNAARVQGWVDNGTMWLAPACYPFCMFGSLVRALVIMLLASLAGLIFNAAFGTGVSYGGLLRLGAVGMTLSVYIDTGLEIARWCQLIDFQVSYWFFIALALTIVYVGFGVAVAGKPVALEHDFGDNFERDDYGQPRRPREDLGGGYDTGDGGFKSGTP